MKSCVVSLLTLLLNVASRPAFGGGLRLRLQEQTERFNHDTAEPTVAYTDARIDRSGQHLGRFIELDALAHSRGIKTGAACPMDRKRMKTQEDYDMRDRHINETTKVLHYFGLDQYFKYGCPKEDEDAVFYYQAEFRRVKDWSAILTPEYLDLLRSYVQIPPRDAADSDGRLQVVMHVRRGDVTPCHVSSRYMPNTFYLQLLDLYLPEHCGKDVLKNCKVTIHSVSDSVERFDAFTNRGYDVILDGPMEDAWDAFMTADVLFAAESAFSVAPAIFNKGVVYAPEYDFLPSLQEWQIIKKKSPLQKAAVIEKERLRHLFCDQT